MSISIKRMLKIVASENYDKTNIFYYILIGTVSTIIYGFFMKPSEDILQMVMSAGIGIILLMVASIWTAGIIVKASHNAIKRKKGVFPNPFKEIGSLFLNGLIFNVGISINTTIITLITAIIMIPLIFINPWLSLIAVIPCLYMTFILLGLHFNYLTTLKIEDWFKYKDSINFMKAGRGYFGAFFFKSLALILIYIVVLLTILALAMLLLAGLTLLSGGTKEQSLYSLSQSLGAIIGAVPTGILVVYLTELTAQFIRGVLKNQGKIKST